MADISVTVLAFAVAGTVSCILSLHLASAIMCYDCDVLPHQRDCTRVTKCGPDEECYGERVQTPDGLIKFRSGCIKTSKCYISIGLLPVIGKRSGDTTECSKCCNSSYCNLETCDKPYASNRKRCLSCKYAVRPDECSESIQCRDGEVCYSQTLIHNSERRYRLGCIHRQQCGINTISHVSVGIQQADEYCAQCCDGNNCNRDICGQRKVQHYKLITPPPLPFCRDNSTLTCAAKTTQCSQEYYKFYQCPFTCNQCKCSDLIVL
ncbi:uncharacterized protein [Mytilus edulis]|uniref:uncharacterized protein n=1 Tax=Mytilus edulis TaxID=6550 RepID=UPI0039F0D8C8